MNTSTRLALPLVLFALGPSHCLLAQEFTNHTYQAIAGNFTWHQAEADAESRGGHLATITSQAEFDYVLRLGVLPATEAYWLGATDEAQEGVWVWVTGEPWVFTAWSSGEPNNQGGESYLTAGGGSNHTWNDWGSATSTRSLYLFEAGDAFCSPHKAKATPQVVNGFVVGATITDTGCGYTNTPLVLVQGGSGSGATAEVVLTDGKVTKLIITDAGFGYDTPPRIAIASPPFIPTLNIATSKVNVTQRVVLGRTYVLESSTNMSNWSPVGAQFTAESEEIVTEVQVNPASGQQFRIRQVQ